MKQHLGAAALLLGLIPALAFTAPSHVMSA